MKRKTRLFPTGLILIIVLSLALASAGAPFAQAQDPIPDEWQELADRADQFGRVRVMLGLDTAFQAEGTLATTSAKTAQQLGIAATQEQVVTGMRGADFEVTARYKYIPYMAAEVDGAALQKLATLPQVRTVQEDALSSAGLSSSTKIIGAPRAWQGGLTGAGQTIAILDSGVDKTHPFFTTGGARVVSEACYSTTSTASSTFSVCPGGVAESTAVNSGVDCRAAAGAGNPDAQEKCEHGTHVAGIAAGDDGGPNIGVARDANIISIQVFSLVTAGCSDGKPSCISTYASDQIKGLERVYELRNAYNIAAVNMSLYDSSINIFCDTDARKAAVDNLLSVNIATVIISGNDGYIYSVSRPGCISTAVTVGATDNADKMYAFSNIGQAIDLLAPGVGIVSSVPGGGTEPKSGTSMAAPHVAGTWAVIKQRFPTASVNDVLQALQDRATLVDDDRPAGQVNDMARINLDRVAVGTGVQHDWTGAETGLVSVAPFNTVTEGVQATPSGGFLWISPGTYNESLTIDQPLELRVRGVGNVTISGQ